MSLSRDSQEEERKLARMQTIVTEFDQNLLASEALDKEYNALKAEFSRLFANAMKTATTSPSKDATPTKKMAKNSNSLILKRFLRPKFFIQMIY